MHTQRYSKYQDDSYASIVEAGANSFEVQNEIRVRRYEGGRAFAIQTKEHHEMEGFGGGRQAVNSKGKRR